MRSHLCETVWCSYSCLALALAVALERALALALAVALALANFNYCSRSQKWRMVRWE